MAPTSRTARGSTPTASRSATKLVDDKAATRPASRDSLKQKMLKKPEEAPRPNKSEEVNGLSHVHNGTKEAVSDRPQQLKLLKTDFDSLRQNLTCKICARLFYQPYTISCGHTYCYTVRCPQQLAHKHASLTDSSVSARGSRTTRTARHVPTAA
jgi:hypothetical protein